MRKILIYAGLLILGLLPPTVLFIVYIYDLYPQSIYFHIGSMLGVPYSMKLVIEKYTKNILLPQYSIHNIPLSSNDKAWIEQKAKEYQSEAISYAEKMEKIINKT